MNENNLSNILENFKKHIDKTIYTYLFMMMKYIFIGKENFKTQYKIDYLIDKLNQFTVYINKNIIKNEENFIKIAPKSEIYTFQNFMNILNFIKSQNLMYAGNIIEGILIFIFNFSCKTSKEDYFGRFINNNLEKFRASKNDDLPKWFKNSYDIFQNEEIQDINKLLSKDASFNESLGNNSQMSPIIHKFLFEIMKNKFKILEENENININKEPINKMKIYLNIYNTSNSYISTEQIDYKENSIICLYHYFINKKKCQIQLLYSFLISVYIYHQNELQLELINDPEKVKKNKNDVLDIPYTYQLKDYKVEGRYSNTITSPISIEPRIIHIDFMHNNLRESGLFELGKILSFNKNIKSLNLKSCLIYDYYLDFFIKGFLHFDNYTLEELNLSKNKLGEYANYDLAELIKHLKGLKTLNIFGNTGINGGFRHLFIALKSLYEKGKTSLVNLNINNCSLTDSSFYELGELLKSPYCGLKRLNIALNTKCYTVDFLKKLKYNRSLDELIIYTSGLNDNDIDAICRIISNSNIKKLNLYRNNFHIFGKTLRIVFRGKLIQKKKIRKEKKDEGEINGSKIIEKKNKKSEKDKSKEDELIIDLSKTLMHLDLSTNFFYAINHHHIRVFNEFIEKYIIINCLDISHIIYGKSPDLNAPPGKKLYQLAVNDLLDLLKKSKKEYETLILQKVDIERDIENYEMKNEEQNLQEFEDDKIQKYIGEIIENKLSIYSLYLKEQCDGITKDEQFKSKLIDYIKYKKNKDELKKINRKLEWKKLVII